MPSSPPPTSIPAWPEDERPRERLLSQGPERLSTTELLAILLRTGRRGQSAVELSRHLLNRYGGLRGLERSLPEDIRETKGLGPAKVAQLKAALELGKRLLQEERGKRPVVGSSQEAYAHLRLQMRDLPKEVFTVLLLSGSNELLHTATVSEGSLTESPVYPREIVRLATRYQAAALLFAHNHPSGNPRPSAGDRETTADLVAMGELLHIRVLDHIIIGADGYFSFADAGLLQQYRDTHRARHARPPRRRPR